MKSKIKITRTLGCLAFVVIIFFIYCLRLIQWQVFEGSTYQQEAESNSSYSISLKAARGQIYDTEGNVLAGNKTCYNVVMNAITMDDNRNPAIAKVLEYLQADGVEWVDKLPIQINGAGQYEFITNRESEISYLKSSDMLNTQNYATADECMTLLISKYDLEDYSQTEARNIASVRYYMTKTRFSRSTPYVIAEDVPMETVQKISENSKDMPGIEIQVSTSRYYEDGTLAPHLIGTLGSITTEQYSSYDEQGKTYSSDNVSGYTLSDTVGQSGLESAFEETLRGQNGVKTVSVDSNDNVTGESVTTQSVSGNSVYTTINSKLQKVANKSLAENVQKANLETGDCSAGGVVVLDVNTFGVLAASTYPTFDLTQYTSDDNYYYDLMEDESLPLFNRAFDGAFTPGSVFKPLVAIAALEEKTITTGFTYYCPGYYDYYQDGNPPTCYNSTAHGTVDVYSALANSCNVFFFEVSRLLGIGTMNVYANAFGLGVKTGIEVGETSGIMSNPQEYVENHGTGWVDGLTIQSGIGQSDSMFSPLQLATYTATIANDGVRLKTHLYSKTVDYDGNRVLDEYEPQVVQDTEISKKTLKAVKEGMREVATVGTASGVFADYGIAIACKTGTAENPGHNDNTVFIAYAPYDNPEIAVAVVLEYGKNGDYSKAVAKDIFDAYFYGTGDDENSDENSENSDSSSSENSSESSSSEAEEASETSETKRGDDIPDVN